MKTLRRMIHPELQRFVISADHVASPALTSGQAAVLGAPRWATTTVDLSQPGMYVGDIVTFSGVYEHRFPRLYRIYSAIRQWVWVRKYRRVLQRQTMRGD